jgi:hypothetical protein
MVEGASRGNPATVHCTNVDRRSCIHEIFMFWRKTAAQSARLLSVLIDFCRDMDKVILYFRAVGADPDPIDGSDVGSNTKLCGEYAR